MSSKFLELAKKSEKLLEELKKTQEELDAEMKLIGLEKYIQDPDTLAVYKIIEPNGTFISFKKIDYKRTNLEGEKGGGPSVLAKKEAEELGFKLKL
jgi:hypothetical protein